MPLYFVARLGYTVNGDTRGSADYKVAWERVEKICGGRGNKVPRFFDVVLNKKKMWNKKGPIPPCPSATNPGRLRQRPIYHIVGKGGKIGEISF